MKAETQPDFLSRQVISSRYSFVDLTPEPGVALAVVCAGQEECSPDYAIRRDGFRFFAVEHILSGEWELTVGGEQYRLGPGHVFSYGPDTAFALRALPGRQRLDKQFVDFTGEEAAACLSASGLAGGRPRVVVQTRWIRDIFDQLVDGGNPSGPALRPISRLLLELLLLQVREQKVTARPDGGSHERFQHCREYIRSHFQTLASIDEAARACHLDPAYLSRLFQKYAEETPYKFLLRLKMEHAATALLRRRLTVKQAAFEIGLGDPYHFSRLFKKYFGQAPRPYIQEILRKSDPAG